MGWDAGPWEGEIVPNPSGQVPSESSQAGYDSAAIPQHSL